MSKDIRSLLDDVADFIAMVDFADRGGLVSPEMRADLSRRIDAARVGLPPEKIGVEWSDPNPNPPGFRYLGLPPLRREGAPLIDDNEPWRWGL